MSSPLALRPTVTYLWRGPATLAAPLNLEWRLCAVRWLGIVFMAPGLLLAHLDASRLAATYSVLVLAAAYNLVIQRAMVPWPRIFITGYVTAIGDSLLNIAMISLGGGFNSPFYFLLFTVTISAAMRYGYGPALATVSLFVGLDAIESVSRGTLDATFVFRSGFLCITAVLAGYLREQARKAEVALEERLRQANLLNQATATLGASLDFHAALNDVAHAACKIFGAVAAGILCSAAADGTSESAVVIPPSQVAGPAAALTDELGVLCRQRASRCTEGNTEGLRIEHISLRDTHQVLLLVLGRTTRHAALATLALLLPERQSIPALDPDIFESFAKRTLLVLENAMLYRTLATRSDDLQRAYSDLAAAHQELLSVDEMKTNFLANVSHELRTPLSSIRSFSELLLSYENDTAIQQEFLHIINSESERLTRLVNDVLDITKIESGKMDWHMRHVHLSTLLHETARTYTTLMAEHHLTFYQEIDEDLPRIYADRDRLQQVIGNLLNNAVKFTPSGSITLRTARAGNDLHIIVADTGIGIAPDDQERIFEKFQQVGDTLTDKPRGTGLGLSICRDIVAHHGGSLLVESQPGRGSVFTVSLPLTALATLPTDERIHAA